MRVHIMVDERAKERITQYFTAEPYVEGRDWLLILSLELQMGHTQ